MEAIIKRLSQRGLAKMKVKTNGSGLKHHMILSYPKPYVERERQLHEILSRHWSSLFNNPNKVLT